MSTQDQDQQNWDDDASQQQQNDEQGSSEQAAESYGEQLSQTAEGSFGGGDEGTDEVFGSHESYGETQPAYGEDEETAEQSSLEQPGDSEASD